MTTYGGRKLMSSEKRSSAKRNKRYKANAGVRGGKSAISMANSPIFKKTAKKVGKVASRAKYGVGAVAAVGAYAIKRAQRKTEGDIAKYSRQTNKAQDNLTKVIKSRRGRKKKK